MWHIALLKLCFHRLILKVKLIRFSYQQLFPFCGFLRFLILLYYPSSYDYTPPLKKKKKLKTKARHRWKERLQSSKRLITHSCYFSGCACYVIGVSLLPAALRDWMYRICNKMVSLLVGRWVDCICRALQVFTKQYLRFHSFCFHPPFYRHLHLQNANGSVLVFVAEVNNNSTFALTLAGVSLLVCQLFRSGSTVKLLFSPADMVHHFSALSSRLWWLSQLLPAAISFIYSKENAENAIKCITSCGRKLFLGEGVREQTHSV